MRIIFAGTPEFAVPTLTALIQAGHQIVMVLTQPDRPSGRGMKLKASPVKQLAIQHNIEVFQPETLKEAATQAHIAAKNVDVMIVAAYGLIIPTAILNMPKYGCYNVHASLLPRWRGAAPIQRAILAGDTETGVTIMEVVPALDAGAMVCKGSFSITGRDTAQSLHDRLSQLGAHLMTEAMGKLSTSHSLTSIAQDESLVTYAAKLIKSEAVIDWQQSAVILSRQIRAFNPFPVAHTLLDQETCRIWMAVEHEAKPEWISSNAGEICDLSDGIVVACGVGFLKIEELQMPGGKRLSSHEFLLGNPLRMGQRFT